MARRTTAVQKREPLQERSRERVQRLLDATAAIVEARGVEAVTTNAIAEEAGLRVGTLYQFFDNREGVLAAVLERQLQLLDERFQPLLTAAHDDVPLAGAVDAVLGALSRAYLEIPALATLVQTLRGDPRYAKLTDANNRVVATWVAELAERRVAGISQARARAVATVIVEAADAVLMAWLREVRAGRKTAARALLAELRHLVLGYLGTILLET